MTFGLYHLRPPEWHIRLSGIRLSLTSNCKNLTFKGARDDFVLFSQPGHFLEVGMITVLLSLQPFVSRIAEVFQRLAFVFDGPGMLLVALLDSSFLSIPEGNDLLIVMLSIGKSMDRVAYYVLMTIIGSVAGCLLLYTIGRKGGSPLLKKRFSSRSIERAERLFEKYGILTLVIPSILPPPCPFKIFVLSAGVFRVRLAQFLGAVALGRSIRYSMWGILAALYGTRVKLFMQNNLATVGFVLFGMLIVILASLSYFYFRHAARRRRSEEPDSAPPQRLPH